jgi:ABC-type Zn uptake system ZnuABC Zn-binding protein ZnuA
MKFIALPLLLFFVIFSSCRQAEMSEKHEGSKHPEGKLRVITTIAPLYSFAKNVAGNYAEVDNLLPSGAGPHDYSLSPEDVMKMSKARVIIENGVGLETWLDKVTARKAGVSKQIVVDSSRGVDIISNDPHIWLSPRNALIQVRNIRDAFVKADPANAEQYAKNAEAYMKRLERLDRDITQITASLKRKEFVSLHSAFLYFARDYGLRQAAVIQELPEREPTPRHIAEVMSAIKANNIRVIFSEPGVPHKVVQTIAGDLNLQVYSLNTLETGDLYPEWYETRMRANLEILKTAMSQ